MDYHSCGRVIFMSSIISSYTDMDIYKYIKKIRSLISQVTVRAVKFPRLRYVMHLKILCSQWLGLLTFIFSIGKPWNNQSDITCGRVFLSIISSCDSWKLYSKTLFHRWCPTVISRLDTSTLVPKANVVSSDSYMAAYRIFRGKLNAHQVSTSLEITVGHHLWKSVFEYNFQLWSWKLYSKTLFHRWCPTVISRLAVVFYISIFQRAVNNHCGGEIFEHRFWL